MGLLADRALGCHQGPTGRVCHAQGQTSCLTEGPQGATPEPKNLSQSAQWAPLLGPDSYVSGGSRVQRQPSLQEQDPSAEGKGRSGTCGLGCHRGLRPLHTRLGGRGVAYSLMHYQIKRFRGANTASDLDWTCHYFCPPSTTNPVFKSAPKIQECIEPGQHNPREKEQGPD